MVWSVGDRDDLGHTLDTIAQDALDAGLHRLGGGGARAARPDELDGDLPRLLVHLADDDVATVGLERRPDHVDGRQDLLFHAPIVPVPRPLTTGPTIGTMLAHQGGWDEALFVVVPIALLGLLLWLATRRAAAEQRSEN